MRPSLVRLALACGVMLSALAVAGCGASGATPAPTYPPGAIVVTARNLTFDTTQLILPADTKFPLILVNKDVDQHNIQIRTGRGFDGDLIFRHDPISLSTVIVEAGPIAPGTYFFICEYHPVMTGTVIVQ